MRGNAAEETDFRFPGAERLTRSQFQKVFRKGRRFSDGILRLRVCGANSRKVGFVCGKRAGIAVKRNRIKRLMRECYRQYRGSMDNKVWLVVIAGEKACSSGYRDIERSFIRLLKKAGCMW